MIFQKAPTSAPSSESEETIQVLNKRITEMLENIEKLGSEGEVEQAQAMMKLCDQLKEEREQLQAQKGGVSNITGISKGCCCYNDCIHSEITVNVMKRYY